MTAKIVPPAMPIERNDAPRLRLARTRSGRSGVLASPLERHEQRRAAARRPRAFRSSGGCPSWWSARARSRRRARTGQPRRQPCRGCPVAVASGPRVVQQRHRARDRYRGEDEVDVHAVAPAERLRERATEQQADRGAAAGDRGEHPECLGTLGRLGEGGGQKRQGGGREHRPECALYRARRDQHREGLGGAADRGGERKARQAGDQRPLASEPVAEPAARAATGFRTRARTR